MPHITDWKNSGHNIGCPANTTPRPIHAQLLCYPAIFFASKGWRHSNYTKLFHHTGHKCVQAPLPLRWISYYIGTLL